MREIVGKALVDFACLIDSEYLQMCRQQYAKQVSFPRLKYYENINKYLIKKLSIRDYQLSGSI